MIWTNLAAFLPDGGAFKSPSVRFFMRAAASVAQPVMIEVARVSLAKSETTSLGECRKKSSRFWQPPRDTVAALLPPRIPFYNLQLNGSPDM
jgi:hypothetical protein